MTDHPGVLADTREVCQPKHAAFTQKAPIASQYFNAFEPVVA